MTTPAMTKTDLLLLGLLLDRPMHGYELYQQIQAEGIDGWFNVSAAGVYYSLRKLRDHGLVAESRQQGRRSSRKSICRLTEKGRSVFFPVMEAELASQEETCLDYDLVIHLLNKIPLRRAIPQLEQRRAFLSERAEEIQAALAAERENGGSPLRLAILDHRCRFLEMERSWLGDVICDIQEGGDALHAQEGRRRGLMILAGDLRDYHLPDLIRFIVSGRHSGTLTVTDGAEIRTLGFEDGQPVCASFQRRGQPIVPPSSCEQVTERICELFHWQEGQFTFDQGLGCQEWCIPVECSAEDLILRGCRKVDNWAIIQRLVPSSDTIFELGSTFQHLDRLELTPTEERVVMAVDGAKGVAAIARELDLTLFETSQACYCLTAIGVLRSVDVDKIRLRRVFREIAELVCHSTALAWHDDPEDRTCEQEVNAQCAHLPIHLNEGRLKDQTDPQMDVEELNEMYQRFLQKQFQVVSRRFGRSHARQAYEQMLRQLAPELQDVAKRYGFDRLAAN